MIIKCHNCHSIYLKGDDHHCLDPEYQARVNVMLDAALTEEEMYDTLDQFKGNPGQTVIDQRLI